MEHISFRVDRLPLIHIQIPAATPASRGIVIQAYG